MAEQLASEGPAASEWDNYPLACHEAFLEQARKCQTASLGARRHFIYPKVDQILDDFLAWAEIFGA